MSFLEFEKNILEQTKQSMSEFFEYLSANDLTLNERGEVVPIKEHTLEIIYKKDEESE